MELNQLPGTLKAAILVQALSREAAEKILGRLTQPQREQVHRHLSQMGSVAPDLVEKVAREFTEKLRKIGRSAVNRSKAPGNGGALNGTVPPESRGLQALLKLDPEQLYNLIKDEHPQTLAIVMVNLESDAASDILSRMPDELKTEVALRIANLEKVHTGMLEEINRVFEEILSNKDSAVTHVTGGVERLAEILNQIDEHSNEHIIGEIEAADPELAARIKQKMFVFDDLVLVDDRGFQKLLRRVETAELATALKAATEEVKEKVFRNMSSRAAEMLREEIEEMGPVRMRDVSDAQLKITNLIQEMEVNGEVIISGRRGEQFIA
jgi:flagellar motor switch protein FliG